MAVYFFSLAAAFTIMFPCAGLCRQSWLQPVPGCMLQPVPGACAGMGCLHPYCELDVLYQVKD